MRAALLALLLFSAPAMAATVGSDSGPGSPAPPGFDFDSRIGRVEILLNALLSGKSTTTATIYSTNGLVFNNTSGNALTFANGSTLNAAPAAVTQSTPCPVGVMIASQDVTGASVDRIFFDSSWFTFKSSTPYELRGYIVVGATQAVFMVSPFGLNPVCTAHQTLFTYSGYGTNNTTAYCGFSLTDTAGSALLTGPNTVMDFDLIFEVSSPTTTLRMHSGTPEWFTSSNTAEYGPTITSGNYILPAANNISSFTIIGSSQFPTVSPDRTRTFKGHFELCAGATHL